MKGFDDKALLLFPYGENYEAHSEQYKYKFKQCLCRLTAYLHSQDIDVHALLTDDVARIYKIEIDTWVSPISKADRFFASKYCDDMEGVMKLPSIEYNEIYADCARKDPGTPDMSTMARFELVQKHCTQACAAIIPRYPIVIQFQYKGKAQYKVTSKPSDRRIRISIDANSFVPTVRMSGDEVSACDVLGVPYGNRSLLNWEV